MLHQKRKLIEKRLEKINTIFYSNIYITAHFIKQERLPS